MGTKEEVSRKKSFDAPDHIRSLEGRLTESLELGDLVLMRVTMQPGWRWSRDAAGREGTAWCERLHVGYQLSGRHRVRMADGSELDVEPGDFFIAPPGHDDWVVGDEPSIHISIAHRECESPQCRDLLR